VSFVVLRRIKPGIRYSLALATTTEWEKAWHETDR